MQQHSFTSLTSRVSNCYIVYNNTYFNINRHADRYADTNTDGFVDILSITNAVSRSNADRYADTNTDGYTNILSDSSADTDGYANILSITNADTRSNADGYTDAIRQFKAGM